MTLQPNDLVLVTGASGFVGGALADLLHARGFQIRAFIRTTSPRTHIKPDYQVALGDVTDRDSLRLAMRDVRFVFHTAADYRLWTSDPGAMLRTNVEGTRFVMEEAQRAGVERIVYTSSVATLAPIRGERCDETRRMTCLRDLGPYKRSKVLSERLVEEMIDRDHLPAVIVNPAAPLGPGDVRPTPTGRIVLEALRGRMPAFVDTGLDVVHVDDVAQGHIAALEHGKIGEKYILGGDNIDLATLLGEIAALTARRAPRLRLPRAPLLPLAYLNEFVARFTGHDPFLNVEGLRLSGKSMFFNDAKARNELGYRSRPYREAIADAVRWFQAREDEKASGAAALRLTGQ